MGAHTFYNAIARALILREGGTRKGSPFANNPVGIICKSGGTHTFVQSDSLCPDFTRRGKSLQGVNIPMRSESVNAVQLRFNKASGDRNG